MWARSKGNADYSHWLRQVVATVTSERAVLVYKQWYVYLAVSESSIRRRNNTHPQLAVRLGRCEQCCLKTTGIRTEIVTNKVERKKLRTMGKQQSGSLIWSDRQSCPPNSLVTALPPTQEPLSRKWTCSVCMVFFWQCWRHRDQGLCFKCWPSYIC